VTPTQLAPTAGGLRIPAADGVIISPYPH